MIEAVDTFYKYVKGRIIAKNPSRTVVSILDAESWPPKQVLTSSFYLLILSSSTPRAMYNPTIMGLGTLVQWVWIIVGTDLTQSNVGQNRGDRYRVDWNMKSELLFGLYPYTVTKQAFGQPFQQGNQIVEPSTQQVGDAIWWTPPKWLPNKHIGQTGVIYGAAQTWVGQFVSDVITA